MFVIFYRHSKKLTKDCMITAILFIGYYFGWKK